MRYFVLSDIHSFYDEMMQSLSKVGYDQKDGNDFLILCGDSMDRGTKPLEMVQFLQGIPKDRKALVLGNHEDLFIDAVRRAEFSKCDIHNGTKDTIRRLNDGYPSRAYNVCDWLLGKEWVDYYEAGPFTFVHSFVPVKHMEGDFQSIYSGDTDFLSPDHNWRNSFPRGNDWKNARWGIPWKMSDDGLFPDADRILVCGHCSASEFHLNLEGELGDFDIYCHNRLIGLDGTTALTHQVNVLVIDSNGWKCTDGTTGRELDPYSLPKRKYDI